MERFVVIDTNVLVSALLRWDSIPGIVLEKVFTKKIIPVFSEEIMAEYEEVLRRKKFPFLEEDIQTLIKELKKCGIFLSPALVEEVLPDKKDIVFYALLLEARKVKETYLVTGNIKHFPKLPYIVMPREFLASID